MLIPFTNSGFEDLKKHLKEITDKRPEAVLELKRGREMGDLSENGLYKAAKFKLSAIDREIRFFKNLIKFGKVIIPNNNKIIQIGHKVTIETDSNQKEYLIVGEYEANPKENKISYKSPIGQNLIGKKPNDKVDIKTPSGTVYSYVIKKISL